MRGARREGGGGWSCRRSLANTVYCLLAGLTPANGITSSHAEERLAGWLELVAELVLLPFPQEQLHKLTFRRGGGGGGGGGGWNQ